MSEPMRPTAAELITYLGPRELVLTSVAGGIPPRRAARSRST
jgi:hypothetical protein